MNDGNDLLILCKVYRDIPEDDEARLFAAQTGESAPLTPSAKLRDIYNRNRLYVGGMADKSFKGKKKYVNLI